MPVDLFDANFYRAANPGLAEFNDYQAFSHFQTFGLNEGREFSPFVNLNFYRSSNSDLANLNNQQIYNHLQNNGIAEGRNFSPFVDLNFYRAANSDLASLNNEQALQHLQIYGFNEGRDFSLPFDVDEYKSLNLDLVAAGLNNSQLLQHFELNGLNEGRASSIDFNISYYLSNNSDLVAAGFNFKQAYDHYVLYGYNEGRAGVAPPTQQWIQQFGTSGRDGASDVAVDSSGNVCITGSTNGSLGGTNAGYGDALVVKYDNNGNQLWIQQFGSSADEYSTGVAVDSTGNIYITGSTDGSLGGINAGYTDAWVAKYDTSGNRLWLQQLGSDGNDFSVDLDADSTGNVYLTGYTTLGLAGGNDAWIAKYDTSGNRLWLQQIGTSADDFSNGVVVDSAANVYITGSTSGALGGSNYGDDYGHDAWVAKYDTSGNQLWLQQFGTTSSEGASDVAVDSSGNVYLTGSTDGSLGGTNAGNLDTFVVKYDTNGNQLWIQQFGTSAHDYLNDLMVDSAGYVYLTGIINGSSRFISGTDDAVLIKYDSSGNRLWTQQLGTQLGTYESLPSSLASDSTGSIYFTGFTNGSLQGTNAGYSDAWVSKYS